MDDKNPLKMKVTELKAELGRRGLSQTGLKFDLAQRLQTAMDVDEFGALSSLSSPAQSSSSPLIPDPGKDSTDHSDSPPRTPQTPSYEFVQGGPPDEQAQHLEMVAETKGSEAAPSIKQSCMGDASIVVDATQSEGGEPPGTEDILTFEEKLGCGGEGRDKNISKCEGSGDIVHTDIASGEMKPAVGSSRGTVEHGVGDIGGSNEKTNDVVEEYSSPATANEEYPPLGIVSLAENEKKKNGTEDYVRGGEDNTPLSLCDSTNNPARAPAIPRKGFQQAEEENKDQPGVVGAEEQDGKTTQRSGVQPDRSDQKKPGVKQGDTTDDANQGNQEKNEEGPSGLLASGGSLLLSSLSDRMKDREERFRQETKPGNGKRDASEVKGKTAGNENRGPSKASGRDYGGAIDSICGGGGGGGESGKDSVSSAEGACPEVHEAQTQTVEDARRAKLMKRKERFMAPPSASSGNDGLSVKSGNSSSANLGNPLPGCSSRKVPTRVSGGGTSEPALGRQAAASEVAAKMARRSERFGAKGARCSLPREAAPADVRDPRGSFFAEPEGESEGNIQQSPPPPGGYSFDPLPQRQKRARATTAMPLGNGGTPAKRTGADRGVAADGLEATTSSPDAAEERGNNGKAAKKTGERRGVRFQLAGSEESGADESSPLHREEETGKPSRPPSSSAKRVSLDSAFILWGVKKTTAPELSTKTTTTTTAVKRKGAPPTRLCRSGDEDEVHGASNHPTECLDKEGKARKQPQRRGGQTGTAAPQASFRQPFREERVEKKLAEQAAKMAERRKRFAEDPRAPSFR